MKNNNSKRFILIRVLQCGCVNVHAAVEACAHGMFQTGLRFGWQRCCNIHNSLGKCNEVKCHNIPHCSASPQFWQPASAHRCHVCVCVCVDSLAPSWVSVYILCGIQRIVSICRCASSFFILPSTSFLLPYLLLLRGHFLPCFFISHLRVSSPSIFSPSLSRSLNGKLILLCPVGLTRLISFASEGFQVSLPGSCG